MRLWPRVHRSPSDRGTSNSCFPASLSVGGPAAATSGMSPSVASEQYKEHHEAVWSEMLEALRRHGWRNYSLFLNEDGLLFGYFEPEASFQESLRGMAEEDVNTRWQELMAPFFEKLAGRPDQSRCHWSRSSTWSDRVWSRRRGQGNAEA